MYNALKSFKVSEENFDLVIDALQHSDRKVTFELIDPSINPKTGELDELGSELKAYYMFEVCPLTENEYDNLKKMISVANVQIQIENA